MTARIEDPQPPPVPTIDGLLAQRAVERPDTTFLRFRHVELTFAETDRRVSALAAGLSELGVGPGQLVPVLMPNVPELVITWLAVCRLGAVATLLNTALRGPALVHALNLTGADTIVRGLHARARAAHAIAAEVTALRRAVVSGEPLAVGDLPGIDIEPYTRLAATDAAIHPAAHRASDPAMVLFTSGTTGPSKGCVLSHRFAVRQAQLMTEHFEVRDDDVLYCPFPLFHLDATVLTVLPAMLLGTTAAIAERFSVSGFWDDVRRFGATVFDFMGATLTMLHKREADAGGPGQPRPPGLGRARCPSSPRSSRSASGCAWSRPTARPMPASRSTSRCTSLGGRGAAGGPSRPTT